MCKDYQKHLIANLVSKDLFNHQFREKSSLPLRMGGRKIKLPSDHKNYPEWLKNILL